MVNVAINNKNNKILKYNNNLLKDYNNVKNMKRKQNWLKKKLRRRNKNYQKPVILYKNI